MNQKDSNQVSLNQESYAQFTPPDPTKQNCRVASGGVSWALAIANRQRVGDISSKMTGPLREFDVSPVPFLHSHPFSFSAFISKMWRCPAAGE